MKLRSLLLIIVASVSLQAQIGNATWATPVNKNFTEPAWLDQGIVFVGNWEPLVYRRRQGGEIPIDLKQRYLREHTEATVVALKRAGVNMILTHFYKTGLKAESDDVKLAKKLGVLCHKHGMKLGTYIGGTMFAETLLRVPLVVSFTNFMDDSARLADLILPGLHGLERWDFDVTHTLTGHPVFSIAQPVLEPPADARHPYAALRAMARGVGGSVARSLPWDDARSAVRSAARELFDGGRGAVFGSAREEAWTRLLETRDWRIPHHEKMLEVNGAMLLLLLKADAWQPSPELRQAAVKTAGYLSTQLYDEKSGGFMAFQFADEEYYKLTEKERKKTDRPEIIDKVFEIGRAHV